MGLLSSKNKKKTKETAVIDEALILKYDNLVLATNWDNAFCYITH